MDMKSLPRMEPLAATSRKPWADPNRKLQASRRRSDIHETAPGRAVSRAMAPASAPAMMGTRIGRASALLGAARTQQSMAATAIAAATVPLWAPAQWESRPGPSRARYSLR